MSNKIKSFTDLISWQEAHQFVLDVYKETQNFPKEELYSLTNQLRRSVVSVTSNIAEGFARQSAKDKRNFYSMSLGSLAEVQNQLLIARDLQYLKKETFLVLANKSIETRKLVCGLVKSAQSRKADTEY
ncbi:MAG: four helix bundle protein [Candidatus Paceibacterota bacterium]